MFLFRGLCKLLTHVLNMAFLVVGGLLETSAREPPLHMSLAVGK